MLFNYFVAILISIILYIIFFTYFLKLLFEAKVAEKTHFQIILIKKIDNIIS